MKNRNRLILYVILLVLSISVMVMIKKCSRPVHLPIRDYEQIAKSDTLRIVTDYTPLSYRVSGDTVIGFDYELAHLISKRSGLVVEVYPEVSLSKSLEGLNENRYDIVGRPIPITTENKQNYNFAETIQLNKQVLVQRKAEYNNGKKPIRNQLNLGKKELYIVRDTPTRLRIENLSHEIGDTIYIKEEPVYGAEQLVIMVAKGDIDYVVCDETIARKMAKEYSEIDYGTDISFTQFQSWALRKNSPVLLDSLNVWLKEIKKGDEFRSLQKRYFGK
ncbi:transporter substrate-binding domain-containing protein [Coprobacter tertius]|uniref:Transporter substrate-binding domain-containing protein n=1 Tax=Coprobacter tertius TaxID=2944915 RepID=A0ABT1MFI7_9BACT|nr:transporter substrate-binding domain-containing protein [Coprobacter tertius]MCP9611402.1 transporter substrate-binding domain-containing protein [Coprobacter tertius]